MDPILTAPGYKSAKTYVYASFKINYGRISISLSLSIVRCLLNVPKTVVSSCAVHESFV